MTDSPQSEPLPMPADAPPSLSASHADGMAWQENVGEEAKATNRPAANAAPADPPALLRILEALLFVGGAPLSAQRASAAVRGLTPNQLVEAMHTLNHAYRRQGRPYTIEVREGAYVLALRPRFRSVMEQLYGQNRQARLSPAAVDVLSLVAYRQPASKQEVDSLRGADSGAILRQLIRRGLVAIVQRGEAAHKEVLYGTTPRFLQLFKLTNLDDLPQTQDLQKL